MMPSSSTSCEWEGGECWSREREGGEAPSSSMSWAVRAQAARAGQGWGRARGQSWRQGCEALTLLRSSVGRSGLAWSSLICGSCASVAMRMAMRATK